MALFNLITGITGIAKLGGPISMDGLVVTIMFL